MEIWASLDIACLGPPGTSRRLGNNPLESGQARKSGPRHGSLRTVERADCAADSRVSPQAYWPKDNGQTETDLSFDVEKRGRHLRVGVYHVCIGDQIEPCHQRLNHLIGERDVRISPKIPSVIVVQTEILVENLRRRSRSRRENCARAATNHVDLIDLQGSRSARRRCYFRRIRRINLQTRVRDIAGDRLKAQARSIHSRQSDRAGDTHVSIC
jgi:hypothetical protein